LKLFCNFLDNWIIVIYLGNCTIDVLVKFEDPWRISLTVLAILTLPCGLFNFVVVLAVFRLGILVPVIKSLFKKSPLKRRTKKKIFTTLVNEMTKSSSGIINFLLIQPTNEGSRFSGRFQNVVQSRQYSPSFNFFSEFDDENNV